MKQQILKKIDLLIRENSEATDEDIKKVLNDLFDRIAKKSNDKKEYIGYGTVFDSRKKTYTWVYSDRAKEVYGLSKQSYEVVPEGLVTKDNFLSHFMLNLSLIVTALKKYFVHGKYYIKTLTTKVSKDNEIILDNLNVQGDIINDAALVVVNNDKHEKIYEEFVVTLNEQVVKINSDRNLEGFETLLTFMIKEEIN